MGRLFVEYVEDELPRFVCASCSCDLANEHNLIWEGFMGAATPALLLRAAVNLEPSSPKRIELLSTGQYTLVDVRCRACCTHLGWKYLQAENAEQKYKEGAVLLAISALHRVRQPGDAPRPLRR